MPDAISIDSLKKRSGARTLKEYFQATYTTPRAYRAAVRNFTESLAAYSIVCHLLQIKDRHNGNVLLTRDGHCLHIDYGYMLTSSPGKIAFETAAFKLTAEYVDLIGSDFFHYFKTLMVMIIIIINNNNNNNNNNNK